VDDFRQASDRLNALGVSIQEQAEALGVAYQTIRLMRLDPSARGYRKPPQESSWRSIFDQLEERRAVEMMKQTRAIVEERVYSTTLARNIMEWVLSPKNEWLKDGKVVAVSGNLHGDRKSWNPFTNAADDQQLGEAAAAMFGQEEVDRLIRFAPNYRPAPGESGRFANALLYTAERMDESDD